MISAFRKTQISGKVHENRLRDIILGGQDGLVNVLGIVLGVSAASNNTPVLITAALSAAFAEAISMGAVAYTSSMSEHDHYLKEKENESKEMEKDPNEEKQELRVLYQKKGFSGDLLEKIVDQIASDKEIWLQTMMEEELAISDVPKKTIVFSSIIVGLAALIGSLIPVVPFLFLSENQAVVSALVLSAVALFAIGVYEAKTYVGIWWKHGLTIMLIGMGAAFVGYIIGLLFGTS